MSCDAAASAAFLFMAALGQPDHAALVHNQPILIVGEATNPLASEPFYADIVSRARTLKGEVESLRESTNKGAMPVEGQPAFADFESQIQTLAELDMKGHYDLAQRDSDGDLKCILRGIAQDLPVKLKDMMEAKDAFARDLAMREMAYLLNDNVEVIEAPPIPTV